MAGPRTDINEIVAAGDIFVGVSRAALEAMSAAKPVIVAGNEGYHGLFGPDKLAEAQAGNFCCRGLPVSQPQTLLEDVAAAFALSPEERERAGAYGRQVIFDYYSVRRMANDCLAMYEQVRRRKYQVVMSGYYGFANAGDDAILEAIQQAIHEASDDIGVTVLSNDPELTRKQYGMEAIPRFRMWKVFSALRRSDALLSGGGSLLQDTTSTRSLFYYLSVIRCAQLLGKPVMLYANGIGPVRQPRQPPAGQAGSGTGHAGHPAGPQLRPGAAGHGCDAGRYRCHRRPGVPPVSCGPERGAPSFCPAPAFQTAGLLWRCRSGTGRVRASSPGSWPGCATTCTRPMVWRCSFCSCSPIRTGRPPGR